MNSRVQLAQVMHVCLSNELVGLQNLSCLVHLDGFTLWSGDRRRDDTACVLCEDDAIVDEVAECNLFGEHSNVRSGELYFVLGS